LLHEELFCQVYADNLHPTWSGSREWAYEEVAVHLIPRGAKTFLKVLRNGSTFTHSEYPIGANPPYAESRITIPYAGAAVDLETVSNNTRICFACSFSERRKRENEQSKNEEPNPSSSHRVNFTLNILDTKL